ncbi:hypothetical protein B0H63DRAFT_446793 [Podospora didyma]|uniref:Uncharacterized protein n=1 Tax=Podospora didyma TaxID=330526 RepID=A0AAE0NZW5_9PEZI|nr:hypothetical protein B0H63DRAFT_446793 [Podospora didyma]
MAVSAASPRYTSPSLPPPSAVAALAALALGDDPYRHHGRRVGHHEWVGGPPQPLQPLAHGLRAEPERVRQLPFFDQGSDAVHLGALVEAVRHPQTVRAVEEANLVDEVDDLAARLEEEDDALDERHRGEPGVIRLKFRRKLMPPG